MNISKKQFLSYIDRLLEYNKREDNFSKAMADYCDDIWFFHPKDMLSLVVDLLIDLTNDDKDDSMIEYWMYELEYGSKWEPGIITTFDGVDIKLQTPEDLYNYLVLYNENKKRK